MMKQLSDGLLTISHSQSGKLLGKRDKLVFLCLGFTRINGFPSHVNTLVQRGNHVARIQGGGGIQ